MASTTTSRSSCIICDGVIVNRATLHREHTIRMLGENVTLTGWQWVELLDELRPDSDLARRLRELLAR